MRDDTLSIYHYTNFLRLIPLIFPPAAMRSDKCVKPIQIPFSYLTPIPAGLSIKTDVPGKIEFLFPSCLRRYFHERVGWNTRFGSICTRVDNGKRIFVLYCRRSFLLLLLFFSLPFSFLFHVPHYRFLLSARPCTRMSPMVHIRSSWIKCSDTVIFNRVCV